MYCSFISIIIVISSFQGAQSVVHVVTPNSGVSTLSNNVCRVSINCQINPGTGTSITIGSTSICSSSRQGIIDVSRGSRITVSNAGQSYFRVIVSEIANSCNGVNPDGGGDRNSGDCDMSITDETGFISSPEFPRYYPNNKKCSGSFPAKSGFCGVKLFFSRFELEFSAQCGNDFLKLGNKSYCGQQIKTGEEISFEVPINLEFKSNGDVPGKGFQASYMYLENCDEICNKHFKKKAEHINPPITSTGQYPEKLHCSYGIENVTGAYCVEVEVKSELTGDELAKLNLKIGNIAQVTTTMPVKTKVNFPKDGSQVAIDVTADGITDLDKSPFSITYKQITNPKQCNDESCTAPTSTPIGELLSPGYPNPYPKNHECEYQIYAHSSDYTKVSIVVTTSLPPGDKLEIVTGEGDDEKFEKLESLILKELDFEEGKPVRIKFTSNSNSETTFKIMTIQKKKEAGGAGGGDGGGGDGGGGAGGGGGGAGGGGGSTF